MTCERDDREGEKGNSERGGGIGIGGDQRRGE